MKTNIGYKYTSALLIDDNNLDNFINQKMLETTVFAKNIYISTDGKKALDFINDIINSNENNDIIFPEIIFVDLNMPVMGGFEFIENFKKLKDTNSTKCKVVILTSSINPEEKIRSGKLDGSIIFLNKPLTNEILDTL